MRAPVRLFVAGEPAPQGSKNAYPYGTRTDRACGCRDKTDDGKPRPKCRHCFGGGVVIELGVRLTESSDRVEPWREAVARAARPFAFGRLSSRTPVRTALVCAFARPPAHVGPRGLTRAGREFPAPTGRNLGDGEKLERAVNDAISSVLLDDDADVVKTDRIKVWTLGPPGLYLSVAPYAPGGETVETLLEAFGMAELRGTGTFTIGHAGQEIHDAAPIRRVDVAVGDWATPAEPQPDLFAPPDPDDGIPFR